MFNKVLRQLNDISATPGSKAKSTVLAEHLTDDLFREVVYQMLNPMITFGLTTYPKSSGLQTQRCYTKDDVFLVMKSLRLRSLTGDAARSACTSLEDSGFPRDLMLRILTKDPGAGFGATTVNKIIPKFIPTFPYMRCSRPKEVKKPLNWAKGVYVQRKMDGMYINCNYETNGLITFSTRQGTDVPVEKFPYIRAAVESTLSRNSQTHGEFIVYKDGVLMERALSNGLVNKVIKGEAVFAEDELVVLVVWDQIPLTSVATKGKWSAPYSNRYKQLELFLDYTGVLQIVETRICHSPEQSRDFFREILKEGGEGTVEKDPDMPWIDGTSKFQIKRKMTAECDLRIVGYRPGEGKNASSFGSVICRSEDELLEVAVAIPDEAQHDYVQANRDMLVGTIMEVAFNVITEPSASNPIHSLFLPRIVELGKHKTVAETLAQIKINYEAALENAE